MGDWPLTGRGEEMATLAAIIGTDERSAGVLIAGGAGVGKTRLAREAAAVATQRGYVVRSVQGTAAAQAIPLGAFAQWITELTDQPLTLVASVITQLTDSPDNAPVLVVVDDIQLLDDLSAFVLHQLIRREVATVVATLRTGEPTPKSLTELWKDGDLRRLDLRPLSRQECAALLSNALGGPLTDRSAKRLWELTRGNVFYLHELVRQELHAGRLVRSDGDHWTWGGSITVSPSLADLVDVHIGSADEPVLEVVDLLAVAEPLELGYLVDLVDAQAIEDAERLELIRVSHEPPTDLVRIAHPLFGETRRSRLGLMRARRLRGRVARAMSAPQSAAGPADPVRLSLLWLDSDMPGDADVHHRGAAAAFRRLDMALSERLAEAAIRAGAGPASDVLRARTLTLLGRADDAEELLNSLPAPSELDAAWVDATTLRALNLLFAQGKPEQSSAVIDDALADAPAPLAQGLLAFRALQLAMDARPTDVMTLVESIDRDKLNKRSAVTLNFGHTIALGDRGLPGSATQAPEDGFVLAPNSPVAAYQAVALALVHADALMINGCISAAVSLGESVRAQWVDLPKVPQNIATAVTGVAALACGDLPTALNALGTVLQADDQSQLGPGMSYPYLGVGYWLGVNYTEALARAGQIDAASEALEEVQHNPHPAYVFIESNVLLAAAWVAAAKGRITEAVALARQAAAFARNRGQHAREVLSLQTAIQFGDYRHGDRLAELSDLVDGPRAPIVLRWARAQADNDGEELLEVSGDLEAMGDRIAAADAAAHAARAFARQNLRGSKLTASGRATRLISECGATTPACRDLAAPLPLTNREREIAMHVRDGLSNREIAESLIMSVRTVEGHIYRACTKLGLANRSELAKLMAQFTA